MKIGLMQPYLIPYIGYFQLINAVDIFVVHDDVQYIKNGWINRNKIFIDGKQVMLTLPVKSDSAELKINQRIFAQNVDGAKKKFLRQIHAAYSKAPFFNDVYSLAESFILINNDNVSSYIINSISKICYYIGIDTEIKISSLIEKDNSKKSEDRVIEICKVLNATEYINPIGGTTLYDKKHFTNDNITLKFIKTNDSFLPFISIIHILMFNPIDEIKDMLFDCTFI